MIGYAIRVKTQIDSRGTLIPIEIFQDITFDVSRLFFISDMPVGAVRGNHANMDGESLIILLSGKIDLFLDDGHIKQQEILSSVGCGWFIPKGIWVRLVNKTDYTVVCIIASNMYSKESYENNYDMFIAAKRGGLYNV